MATQYTVQSLMIVNKALVKCEYIIRGVSIAFCNDRMIIKLLLQTIKVGNHLDGKLECAL